MAYAPPAAGAVVFFAVAVATAVQTRPSAAELAARIVLPEAAPIWARSGPGIFGRPSRNRALCLSRIVRAAENVCRASRSAPSASDWPTFGAAEDCDRPAHRTQAARSRQARLTLPEPVANEVVGEAEQLDCHQPRRPDMPKDFMVRHIMLSSSTPAGASPAPHGCDRRICAVTIVPVEKGRKPGHQPHATWQHPVLHCRRMTRCGRRER